MSSVHGHNEVDALRRHVFRIAYAARGIPNRDNLVHNSG